MNIEHVADTAFLIAQCRAIESERPDALFRDPLAARLAGEKGRAVLAAFPTAPITSWVAAVRTVVIDDYIRAAIERGVDAVVNLGAGLDTRPYRMDLPSTLHWIEADYPAVIEYKKRHLDSEAAVCHLERFAVDLADTAARRAFLAMINAKYERVLILTEGVVLYLEEDQVGELATDIRKMNSVQGWIVDYVSHKSHQHRERAGVNKHMRKAPFKFQPEDYFGFFKKRGWAVRETRYLAIEGHKLGRRIPLSRRSRVLMLLLPRKRREELSKHVGYVLLEPGVF